jgi:hypothetical protein
VQAVWSKKNAGVIGVITELGVDDQRVLKEIIESVSRGRGRVRAFEIAE